MSIQLETERIKNAKASLKTVIDSKLETPIPESATLDQYPVYVEQLAAAGDSNIVEQLPQPVTNVQAESTGATSIKLTWTNPNDIVQGVDVAMAENGLPSFPLNEIELYGTVGNATTLEIENLTEGGQYGFLVMPKNANGLRQTCVTADNNVQTMVSAGAFVTGDFNGNIYHSTDGRTWVFKTQILEGLQIKQIIYANNMFLCVGMLSNNVYVYKSIDGITWTQGFEYSSNGVGNQGLAFGNGMFLLGMNYHVYKSTDGETWTEALFSTGLYTNSLTFGNGVFLHIYGASGLKMKYSIDGETWTTSDPTGTVPVGQASFCNDRFIMSNTGYYSINGIDWNASSGDTTPRSGKVFYGNGIYLGKSGSGKLWCKSTDGITWESYTTNVTHAVSDMVFANGQFVLVGDEGTYYSADTINWTAMTGITTDVDVRAVCYGNI